jgi:hypothetical protein
MQRFSFVLAVALVFAIAFPAPASAGVFRHVVKPASKKAFHGATKTAHGAKKAVKASAHVTKKVLY